MHVVLLRGINVGGHRKVPMGQLRAGLVESGFETARTHIQSGNIVVTGGPDEEREVELVVRDVVAERFGLDDVTVMAMRPERVQTALRVSEREFPDDGTDSKGHRRRTHVVFLDRAPEPNRRTNLVVDEVTPDRFVLDIHDDVAELHVSYVDGAGNSKLTLDRIERALDVHGTARNLNTVARLLEL